MHRLIMINRLDEMCDNTSCSDCRLTKVENCGKYCLFRDMDNNELQQAYNNVFVVDGLED